MRILWDLRLFSTGYSDRGIGVWTLRMTAEILLKEIDYDIFIWGNLDNLPIQFHSEKFKVIPWKSCDWRCDLLAIPAICLKHHIDIVHHWVSLGPILTIGLGLPVFSKRIITVYDCAMDLWNTPIANARRGTSFHKIQKILSSFSDHAFCISESTRRDLISIIPGLNRRSSVAYMPEHKISESKSDKELSESFFITLGGAPHKNLLKTIEAFSIFREKYTEYSLVVAGHVEKSELPIKVPSWVKFIEMKDYLYHLKDSAGLLFFSVYEGLGIPVIEALSIGRPVAASDIPSIHEIAGESIVYSDPGNLTSMSDSIRYIAENQISAEAAAEKSFMEYLSKSSSSSDKIISIYKKFR